MNRAHEGAASVALASYPRDATQAVFLSVCALVFCISITATIYFCRSMSGGMEMPGGWTMSMMWMGMPEQTWLTSAAMFLLMWFAMMVAMMLPSAMPMLINYRRCLPVESAGGVGASTLIVACSYFVVWMGIGIAVYVIGVLWAYATMKWSGLSRLVPVLIGATLIFLGVIQFSRWKLAWLMRCRDPLACAASQTGGGWRNPMRHGLQQGVSCAICCSAPMSALLVLGAMDLTVMVFVAVVIAMEKLVPKPEPVVRLFGVVAIVTGIVLVLRSTAF